MLFIIIITGLAAIGLLFLAFRSFRQKRLIDDTPTSKTQGVFIGLTELKGTAESDSPLTSYLAGITCVYYKWDVREQWSRMVTTTTTDGKGHTTVSTHRETGWTTVANGRKFSNFYLKDDNGIVRINPEGAEINDKETLDKTCKQDDPSYYGKGPANEIANSDHRRRFHESAIPLHAQLYVMGQARERQDVVAAEVAKDKSSPMFIISMRSEKQISTSFGVHFWLWWVFGLVIAIGGVIGWWLINRYTPDTLWGPVIFGVIGYLVISIAGWLWTVYNSLVGLKQRTEQAWSQVDIQLKRRHDLIPNLVAAVEGYRTYESETQKLVAELRSQMEATPPGVSGPNYKGILPLLRIVVENYPELKASESFLKLQQSLTETEQRIALARDYFNDIATFYNTRLEIVPDRFAASLARMKPKPLLSASDFERAPVKVNLLN